MQKSLFQILNDQFQPVRMFRNLDEAKYYIETLQHTYKEDFYVVEWPVVHFAPGK